MTSDKDPVRILYEQNEAAYDEILNSNPKTMPPEVRTVRGAFQYSKWSLEDQDIFCFISRSGEYRYLVVADRARTSFRVVVPHHTEYVARTPLRLIREVMLRRLENEGWCFAHCAAAIVDGVGVLIPGDKGAGKSTLLWHLCKQGAAYLSNDRCLIRATEERCEMIGWPLSIRLGVGTLGADNSLYLALAAARLRTQAAELGLPTKLMTEQPIRAKVELAPTEFCSLLSVQHLETRKIDLILAPQLDLRHSGFRLLVPDRQTISPILKSNLREPVDPDYGRGWLDIRTVTDKELEITCHELLEVLVRRPVLIAAGSPRQISGEAESIAASISRFKTST